MAVRDHTNVEVDGVTVLGTESDDNINTSGGSVDYTINGLGGADLIITGDGDTVTPTGGITVNGGAGNDDITGGAGDDNLRGEDDNDTINGGTGADIIDGGAGVDTLNGQDGADNINGGAGDDIIDGGAGDDVLIAGAGNDTIEGGTEDNSPFGDILKYEQDVDELLSVTYNGTTLTVTNSDGTDTATGIEQLHFNNAFINLSDTNNIYGDATGSTLTGDSVNGNTILAGDGADTIDAGNGDNTVFAGKGDDDITIGTGNDTVNGGVDTSEDTVNFGFASTDVTSFNNNGGTITIVSASGGTDTISNVKTYSFTDKNVDVANLATEFASTPNTGSAGNDTLNGTAGNDSINGLAGDDTITPGAGDDTVDGGADADTVVFGINQADVTEFTDNGGGSYTFVSSAEGTDTISNVESFQFADGTVTAANLASTFETVNTAGLTRTGTSGDDNLSGGAFNDTITGDAGNDTLNGLAGNDTITPGAGNDTVDGGDGTDTAVLGVATSAVTSYANDGTTITLVSSEGTDTFTNVEAFNFNGTTVQLAEMDATFTSSSTTNQTFTSTSGNDAFVGGSGTDKTIFGFAAADLVALSAVGGVLTVVGAEGTDTLTSIETLQFSDQTIAVSDLVLGTTSGETVTGTANADIIAAGTGTDIINAGAGDDLIIGAEIGETIDGGAGTDTVKFGFASSTITSAVRKLNGSVEITTADGTTTLSNVENVVFASEASAAIGDIVTAQNTGKPVFTVPDGNGGTIEATPEVYTGPVSYLEYELLGDSSGNVVTGSSSNDFLNLLGGDDAANGGDGDDVLDGGLGSNFLTGGNGGDVFYIDGRGAPGGAITWSTVTDFDAAAGDVVNIWGWVEGTSQLLLTRVAGEDGSGTTGFQGFTHHYDLDGDDTIDTSITFVGLSESPATNEARIIDGQGYQFYGA